MKLPETDIDLLELAAKAAGVDGKVRLVQKPYSNEYTLGVGKYRWNPLQSDGDALRLAVKLRITPHIDGNMTEAESTEGFADEAHLNDPYAATRRAIVRAAAAIGRSMAS